MKTEIRNPNSKANPKLEIPDCCEQQLKKAVAQIGNLLFRRMAFCGGIGTGGSNRAFDPPADSQSAKQQSVTLRYGLCIVLQEK